MTNTTTITLIKREPIVLTARETARDKVQAATQLHQTMRARYNL